jgi:hypothetical protein
LLDLKLTNPPRAAEPFSFSQRHAALIGEWEPIRETRSRHRQVTEVMDFALPDKAERYVGLIHGDETGWVAPTH